jgi:solute carrier family 6 amino acid transporter-like protein 5/7/9/14
MENEKNGREDKEKEGKRENWGNGIEFLMSCISMSVGLGNIWRFPFVAYEHGGGAFLIPYLIVLFLIGRPFYYCEMIIGQFISRGSVKALSIIPILKGVAIGQQFVIIFNNTYYVTIIGTTLFYFIKSFSSKLPWSYCWDKWDDVNCIAADPRQRNGNLSFIDGVSSTDLYFDREVMKQKDDISEGIGLPDWQLILYLFFAWTIIFFVVCKGVKSTGKVAYFMAIFPYIVLITLLIRASTLEGTWDGIKYFIQPDFSKILTAEVWYRAATQLFFSLSAGQGAIVRN